MEKAEKPLGSKYSKLHPYGLFILTNKKTGENIMLTMQKLIDFADAKIREELGEDYYFIRKSRVENLAHCFQSGAERIRILSEQVVEQQKEISRLSCLLLDREDR